MDPQPDVIREQIEETRSSLTEKLETLEAEVKGTVQSAKDTVESAKEAVEETFTSAKETVQETIASVKETMHDATESVKRTFDVRHQVDQHPFAMLGLSFLGGLALGALTGGRLGDGRRLARRMAEASVEPPMRYEESPRPTWDRSAHGEPGKPGFFDKLSGQLGDEMDKVKDMAIAALVGVVSDVAKKSIPALADGVERLMTETASRMGAPLGHEPEGDGGYGGRPEYLPPAYQPPPGHRPSTGL